MGANKNANNVHAAQKTSNNCVFSKGSFAIYSGVVEKLRFRPALANHEFSGCFIPPPNRGGASKKAGKITGGGTYIFPWNEISRKQPPLVIRIRSVQTLMEAAL